MKIDPKHVDALNNKGVVLKEQGRYEEAITYYDKVLAIDFEYDNKLIQEYTKKNVINGLLEKPVEPHELITEVNKQLDILERTNKK